MQEGGKDINEILNMPYHFVIDLLSERDKPQESNSFFDLMG